MAGRGRRGPPGGPGRRPRGPPRGYRQQQDYPGIDISDTHTEADLKQLYCKKEIWGAHVGGREGDRE